jgi:hypothetical protein
MKKKNGKKLLSDFRKTCSACGLKKYVSRSKDTPAYELRLKIKSCQPTTENQDVFHSLSRDAMFNEKEIFSNQIVGGYNWMFREHARCNSFSLKYRSEEDMMSDLIAAGIYIKNNLKLNQKRKGQRTL